MSIVKSLKFNFHRFKAFRIISNSDETHKITEVKLQSFLSEYIIKNEIRLDSARLLTEQEVNINFSLLCGFSGL